MAKKIKNRQKQKLKKAQKQKKRHERIKQHALSKQVASRPSVEDMVDYALELVDNGDWHGGERILEKLKKKYRHHAHVCYGLGVLAAFDDKHDEAIHFFSRATQITPNFVEAYYNLGVAYQKQLNVPEMIKAFRQVIKFGESDNFVVNQAQDILSTLEKQIQNSDGVDIDGYLKGFQIFEEGMKYMKYRNWDAAIVKFNDTIKINPNNPQPHGNLGICYASIGKIQLALESFDNAIELDPNYEPALLNRRIVESLEEGEKLEKELKTIEYYKDYPHGNRSYIQEVVEEQRLLPEKRGTIK